MDNASFGPVRMNRLTLAYILLKYSLPVDKLSNMKFSCDIFMLTPVHLCELSLIRQLLRQVHCTWF